MRPRSILLLLSFLLAACDPCSDYCAAECECSSAAAEGCEEACLTTMDLYSGPERADECDARLTVLQETCS